MNMNVIKKINYNTIFNISLFLFFLSIFSLNKNITSAYYLLAILGIFSLKTNKVRITDIPVEVRNYIYIIFSLVLLITISILLYNPDTLFRWRYAVYRDLILLPFVFFAFYASNIKLDTLYKIIVIASLITSVWVVLIIVEQPARWSGSLDQPIDRGNVGMLAGIISLTASIYFKEYKWRLISIVGFLSGIFLSILSGSRGGWLALLLAICTLIYQVSKTNKSAIKYILSAFFLVVIIVFFLWDKLPIASRIDQTIASLQAYISGENKITSLGERLEMWRASWYAFLQKPLFGWGWNNSDLYFLHFREQGIIALDRQIGHPHNQYFLFLGELGILGFITFMAMLTYPIQYFIRKISSFNALGDNNGAFICLLPIIVFEAILEFCLSDDSLSQRHFMLIMTVITIFSITFVTKIENKNKNNE